MGATTPARVISRRRRRGLTWDVGATPPPLTPPRKGEGNLRLVLNDELERSRRGPTQSLCHRRWACRAGGGRASGRGRGRGRAQRGRGPGRWPLPLLFRRPAWPDHRQRQPPGAVGQPGGEAIPRHDRRLGQAGRSGRGAVRFRRCGHGRALDHPAKRGRPALVDLLTRTPRAGFKGRRLSGSGGPALSGRRGPRRPGHPRQRRRLGQADGPLPARRPQHRSGGGFSRPGRRRGARNPGQGRALLSAAHRPPDPVGRLRRSGDGLSYPPMAAAFAWVGGCAAWTSRARASPP